MVTIIAVYCDCVYKNVMVVVVMVMMMMMVVLPGTQLQSWAAQVVRSAPIPPHHESSSLQEQLSVI